MMAVPPQVTQLLQRFNLSMEELAMLVDLKRETVALAGGGPARGDGSECSECGGALREALLVYRRAHGYCALLVCALGTAANALNVAVLTRRELAAAPINRLLTALAVADMLLMLEYVPVAAYLYVVLPEQRDYPYGWAAMLLVHAHLSLMLHSVNVCLTLTLAVWRYISIRYPEQARTLCTLQRCHVAIALCYTLPVLACSPPIAVFEIRETRVRQHSGNLTLYHVGLSDAAEKDDKLLYHASFWLYSVVLRLIPCAALSLLIAWLARTLLRNGRRHAALTGRSRRAQRTTRMLVAVLLLFLATEVPSGVLGLLSVLLRPCFFLNCYKLFGEVMDMLALTNGAVNFVLYCAMSRQFRTTFSQLFCPALLLSKRKAPPVSLTQSTCV
ncbi:G-protein coupled receptor dmsr-1-like [Schistocerca gregaria]|uniref:G-protein coupled receptor dmsr-1-like n=1 Tax=Schistocerca gregaria TaxID=7010 RepID=UPI00211DAD06|nr:G-protein coupled receptor dmsr-1-like [Schistocerca gregaria]